MKRICIICLTGLLASLQAFAHRPVRDTVQVSFLDSLTPEYLDTVNINRRVVINDYHMIGVQYGVSFNRMLFNPGKNETFLFTPVNYGVVFTHYGKMFDYMPYFGYQVGVFYGRDGYKTKANKEGVMPTVDGMEQGIYEYIEVPAMAHMHADVGLVKLMANLGIYGGYRLKVHRTISEGWENYTFNVNDPYRPAEPEDKIYGKDYPIKDYTERFYPFDNRLDYGLKGGVGIALMLSPVEIHVTGQVRWAWSSLYQQDYYHKYYYRFAYPLDFILSVGLHFQLTKRTGKTNAQLRREARELVYPSSPVQIDIQHENTGGNRR